MIVGIVLTAGRSSRLGFPKALAKLDGETFVTWAVRALREGGADEICVVVGPPHASDIVAGVDHVVVAHNPEPERGMLSSLQAGLATALRHADLEAVLFSLVDHPRVRPETLRSLWAPPLVGARRPVYLGRGGHPVAISVALARTLAAAPPTATIRELLATEFEDVSVDDPGVVDDIDTPDQLDASGACRP
ncbi:MAG: nucleotidyltransferase family protein [Myxococcales bacterium]|nr:nucleotidyltransferase family protein [Myxococcales bacterium]